MPFGLLIDGAEVGGAQPDTFDSHGPAAGDVLGTFVAATAADVDAAVTAARRAHVEEWSHSGRPNAAGWCRRSGAASASGPTSWR